jgi:tetratricopeptide (TPR) repeat protein
MKAKQQPAAINTALQHADKLLSQGDFSAAAKAFSSVLAADPLNRTAAYNLGVLQHQKGELEKAAASFKIVLQTAPKDAETMIGLAFVAIDKGEMDGAQKWARDACAIQPSARILTKAATIEREAGNLDAARQLFEKAIRQDPLYVDAFYGLGTVQKYSAGDETFRLLKQLATKAEKLPATARIRLAFTLGKAHMDTGDADTAFAHYAEANRLKRAMYKVFTIEKFEKYADSIIALFTPELVEKLKAAGNPSARPVFIVGMPRSGSTLTDQIISSHPQAASLGEANFLQRSIPAYANTEVPDFFPAGVPSVTAEFTSKLSPAMLQDIAQKYLSLTEPFAKGAGRLVDKLLFNYLWTGLIRLALPDAKIVHCTRDPRDMGLSIWQLSFQNNIPWAYDQAEIGRYYKAYRRVMAHWEKLFPGAILEMNYETLVQNQERETRRLLDFCGLPFDEACLNFHEKTGKVSTASAAQVRQPMYLNSINKWKKYEKYLQPMIDALGPHS